MEPFLKVNFIGGFSVQCGQTLLIDPTTRINKNLELFALLLLNRHQPLSNQDLIQLLWDKDVINPSAALKNAVYALRKLLQDAMPEVPFILTSGQQYQINPDISIQTDFASFSLLYEQMKQSGVSEDCQIELGRQALQLCRGEFLPCFSSRPWVLPYNHQLLSKYISAACHTATLLLNKKEHGCAQEAFSICSCASMICPQRDDLYPCLFAAMQQLDMKTSVLNYYPAVLELCYNRLQKPIPREVRQVYRWASESSLCEQEDLLQIQMDLSEALEAESLSKGAYFCSYDSFRSIYPMLVRTAAREKFDLSLMLISLQARKNTAVSRQELSAAMSLTRDVIVSSLRKDDIFCRFSKFQYAALLMMNQYADKEALTARLLEIVREESGLDDFSVTVSFCSLNTPLQ